MNAKAFYVGQRAPRGSIGKDLMLNVCLDRETRVKLVELTYKYKKSASDLVRELIARAK